MRRTGLAGLVLLLAACGGGGSDLADADPKGAEACEALAEAFGNVDDTDAAIEGVAKAGEAAARSTTAAISGAVNDLAGTPLPDAQKLRDACADAGVDMPEVPN